MPVCCELANRTRVNESVFVEDQQVVPMGPDVLPPG